MGILNKLFTDWDLSTWANILGIIGFIISLGAIVFGIINKSQIKEIKKEYLFKKRISHHIKNLQNIASNISTLLNDYDQNIRLIQTEFGRCQTELEDLIIKLDRSQKKKAKKLIRFLKRKKTKKFVKKDIEISSYEKYSKTSYEDTWFVYYQLHEIIKQMENIKTNKEKSL